ncbi:NitT/TauT family transport system ATP-binding protein [Nannocystis exedens]|uniref:NitT/TauT family transport system ATP-binding protein n=1 Tax=Nannocystis exedens TaxID=54 RepID=A0A1I2G1M3_9BACT|nr:ABC transporter ATP-binding protein [Nannocystis exedens]PCC74580.1 Bicarbonate transport ATP-binding protein CmpC [Nannocystis exedens]SFF10551.1 NitT/TauT family transport system ATP-binding protein [Nannocystis exedens]
MTDPAPAPHLEARGLGVRFPGGVQALSGLDLVVRRGELLALIGPSGCGKSTLLRVAAGLAPPSEGGLTVAGEAPARARARRAVAFVFQDPTLLPWRSLHQNVRLPLELARVPLAEQNAAADAALALVGLSEFAAAAPAALSGGMKMRASLARALVTRPELLLLDEPFGALDELTRERLNDELLRLWERDRFTALAVTHSVAEAVLLGDRVVVLSGRPGRVVADIAVALPRPRRAALVGSPEFAAIAAEVRARLRAAAPPDPSDLLART